MSVIKCDECEKVIEPGSNAFGFFGLYSDLIFCSKECAKKYHAVDLSPDRACQMCGKPIGSDYVVDKSGYVYCSTECLLESYDIETFTYNGNEFVFEDEGDEP